MKNKEWLIEEVTRRILKSLKEEYIQGNDDLLFRLEQYDATNPNDTKYIKENASYWWNFLQEAYKGDGGFKGLQSVNDLKRKPLIFKLVYANDDMVALAVYNPYISGNKCVGIGSIQGDLHKRGVVGVKLILRDDVKIWKEFYWIEVDKKIEQICNEVGGFNLPVEYADILVDGIKPIDDYHYIRIIAQNECIKTIFGFSDEKILSMVKEKMFDEFERFINNIEKHEVIIDYTKLRENILKGRAMSQIEGAKRIIYLYQDFLINRGIDTYPQHLIDKLQQNIDFIKCTLNSVNFDRRTTMIYQSAVEDGEDVLSQIKPLKSLKLAV